MIVLYGPRVHSCRLAHNHVPRSDHPVVGLDGNTSTDPDERPESQLRKRHPHLRDYRRCRAVAWMQLLETQKLDPETQAAQEVARTAGDPNGQQSSPEGGLEDTNLRITAKNPVTEPSAVEDAHQTPGGTTSVLDRPSGQLQKFESMGRAVLRVEEELQNHTHGQICGSQEGIGEKEQAEGGVRGSGAASSPRIRDAGRNKRRRERQDTSSSEQQASKRHRRETEDCLEPEPELEENMIGLFAEKVVAGLLELASTSGVMASMTRAATKFVFKVRLGVSSRRGTKSGDSYDPAQEEEPDGVT
ncbi:hypothetical protein JX266_013607 [Neoarthrinium moseri]|nr:hypothetical protein JX266_013607 [Neoarthrinium moseri]